MRGRSFILEFVSVFIAVITAFALNNWNDNRKDHIAEDKILQEIRNGLLKDKEDIADNLAGHESGLKACDYWHRVLNGRSVDRDSAALQFFTLTRDFVSIQNRAGYESLKSKGLETIKDDSLRVAIIGIYEYDYSILRKLEEEYHEAQFHSNYFAPFNNALAPWYSFDDNGNMKGLSDDAVFSTEVYNELSMYLTRIKVNRLFVIQFYRIVDRKIDLIVEQIDARQAKS
ncbi:MAG: hypothetical protein KDC00_07175 [Flavobacteriales bacterium]|nr:hypothetical protein [Flavobacteriales bacterium]